MPSLILARIDSPVLDRRESSLDHVERDDRREERERVQPEAPGIAQVRHRDAAERRPQNARHIELNGIQRDRVGHVFLIHQRWNQRLISRAAERLRQARNEGKRQHLPHLYRVSEHQHSEDGRIHHLHILRAEQHIAAVEAVRQRAADQREQKDGDVAEKCVEPQQECVMMAEVIDQPRLRHDLHPASDAGRAGANPHQAEIAVLECFEDPADHGERAAARRKWILAARAVTPSVTPRPPRHSIRPSLRP